LVIIGSVVLLNAYTIRVIVLVRWMITVRSGSMLFYASDVMAVSACDMSTHGRGPRPEAISSSRHRPGGMRWPATTQRGLFSRLLEYIPANAWNIPEAAIVVGAPVITAVEHKCIVIDLGLDWPRR
jgi:hypothetical protein